MGSRRIRHDWAWEKLTGEMWVHKERAERWRWIMEEEFFPRVRNPSRASSLPSPRWDRQTLLDSSKIPWTIKVQHPCSFWYRNMKKKSENVSCSVMSDSFWPPCTVAHQTPLSMEFSRQEYWSGLSFLSPRNLPDIRVEARSPLLQAASLPFEPPRKTLSEINQ